MEVIIPAAGLSTRFPNMPPKYLLKDKDGQLMIKKSVGNLIDQFPVSIGILKSHNTLYNSEKTLKDTFGNEVNILIIDNPTKGPADTISQIIKNLKITGSIFIKDCDNYWKAENISEENSVWTGRLSDYPTLSNVSAKSYVVSNDQDIIINIVEKKVVSENFVAGGYQFNSSEEFIKEYETISRNLNSEIFISAVIDSMIHNKKIFFKRSIKDFIDVGTINEWREYNR